MSSLRTYLARRVRRAYLRIVYCFSPTQYWNLRSRDISKRWFDDSADYRIMKEMIDLVQAKTCLEVGCNGGRFSRFLANDVEQLECQDVSRRALEMCSENLPPASRDRVKLRCGALVDLYGSQPVARFDLTISNRVISAIPPKQIAANVRVLAGLSRAILLNELLPGEPGATYYWFAHDYDALLNPLGFTCAHEVVSHSTSYVQRFRLYRRGADLA